MVFALCGGDKRIARLATLLIEDGYGVRAWALEDAPLIDGVRRCGTAEECVNGAGCIVLPMPCAPQRGMLSTPLSPRRHCLGELFAAVPPGALVCAGSVTEEVRTLAEERGARLRDYGALESFRAANSAATAEGTIGELLHETPGLPLRMQGRHNRLRPHNAGPRAAPGSAGHARHGVLAQRGFARLGRGARLLRRNRLKSSKPRSTARMWS